MLECDAFFKRKEVDVLDSLVVDFLDYVSLAAARYVTGGTTLAHELDVSKFVHLTDRDLP